MKKVFVAIVTIIVLFLFSSATAEQEDLYTYQVNDDNTVTITGFDWANNHGDIYIPEMLGSYIVTAIGDEAFRTKDNDPVSITLPENIKTIGEMAFANVNIKYINIPIQTKEIGNGAFAMCSVMQFRVADGHEIYATIDNALYNKKTKTLMAWPTNKDISPIPEGIKAIGDYVFYGRDNIHDGYKEPHFLPSTVTSIGKYAFAYIRYFDASLRSVSEIDDYAFYNAGHVIISNMILKISRVGAHAFENCLLKLNTEKCGSESILLSSTPYVVEDYAFHNCSFSGSFRGDTLFLNLNNVTKIGSYAFANAKVSISENDLNNLTYIGEHAFENVEFPWGSIIHLSKVDKISPFAFYTKSSRWGVHMLSTNDSVREIGEDAFSGQTDLDDVNLGEGLVSIGSRAFKGCKKLSEIRIPTTVTYIGQDVFADCSDTLVIIVESGSYGEIWARTCGYSYKINGKTEDTSWLND